MKTKKCNCCGKEHNRIPEQARFSPDAELPAYYWECDCMSTLVYFFFDMNELRNRLRQMKEARQAA